MLQQNHDNMLENEGSRHDEPSSLQGCLWLWLAGKVKYETK